MDLNSILEKTKKKNKNIQKKQSSNKIKKVNIANKDRPYDFNSNNKDLLQNNILVNNKSNKNQPQSTYKVATNKLQSGYKQTTKSLQIDNKVATNKLQTSNENIVSNNKQISIDKITGLQKKILLYIFFKCQKLGARTTKEISISELMNQLTTTKKNIKTSIYRLEKKNFVIRKDFKNGRGGWTKYEIPEDLYYELFKYQESLNQVESKSFRSSKLTTNNHTSSSINTTTKLSKEWLKIDLGELSHLGFNKNHIQQISNLENISPEELQQAIDFFVFDLEENNKASEIKKSPIDFFMGILRRQGFYNAPKNYESPKDKALRIKIEQAQKQQERRQKMENELIDVEFAEWKSNITNAEKEKIFPEEVKKSRFDAEREGYLRTYFKDNFWNEIKKKKHADCF